jgi:hypothetical protein
MPKAHHPKLGRLPPSVNRYMIHQIPSVEVEYYTNCEMRPNES